MLFHQGLTVKLSAQHSSHLCYKRSTILMCSLSARKKSGTLNKYDLQDIKRYFTRHRTFLFSQDILMSFVILSVSQKAVSTATSGKGNKIRWHKFHVIINLLPFLPITKFTFELNLKSNTEWHMKFFNSMDSTIPTSASLWNVILNNGTSTFNKCLSNSSGIDIKLESIYHKKFLTNFPRKCYLNE